MFFMTFILKLHLTGYQVLYRFWPFSAAKGIDSRRADETG
jgi:hypothetical protein